MSISQKLFLGSSLFLLAACGTAGIAQQAGPSFEKGMLDGCRSAVGDRPLVNAVYGGEASLIDKIYARAWSDGFDYCHAEPNPALTT